MAGEKQPELGVRNPFQARYRVTIPGCKGWRQDQDRSTLLPEELYSAINVRVIDGIVVCRGGESPAVNAGHATTGCVQGIIDINGGGPRFVLAMQRSDTLSLAADIDIFDYGIDPPYQRVTSPPTHQRVQQPPLAGGPEDPTAARQAYLWWNEQIVFGGLDGYLYRFIFPDDNFDVDTIQVDRLFELRTGSTTFQIASMCTLADTPPSGSSEASNPKLGPPLYMGTIGGGVFCWVNGEMKELLPEGTFNARVIVFRYNDRLYACSTQDLRVQTGWTTGGDPASTTFTAVALPGTLTGFVPCCGAEFSGFGFIGGTDTLSAAPKGRVIRISDAGGAPVATVTDDGTGNKLICVDDFALVFGSLYASFRHLISVTEFGDFADMGVTGVTGSPATTGWSESGQIPRMVGAAGILYLSAWASGSEPVSGNPGSGIWSWDGTTLTKLSSIAEYSGNLTSPWDMVAF